MVAKKKTKRNPKRKIATTAKRVAAKKKRVARRRHSDATRIYRAGKTSLRRGANKHKLFVIRVDKGRASFWLTRDGRLIDSKSMASRGSLSAMRVKARGLSVKLPENIDGIWVMEA